VREALEMATKRPRASHSKRSRKPSGNASALARYKAEAREIAAARQAMKRLHRGVEFEPERLHYVTDLHSF